MLKVISSFMLGALLLTSNSSFATDDYVCDKATLARIQAGDKALERAMDAKYITLLDLHSKVLNQISLARADLRAQKLSAFIPHSNAKIEAYEELASLLQREYVSAFPCANPIK
jgi:hypothetical protein